MIAKQGEYLLRFQINQTDLLAPTTHYLSSPCDGFIDELETVVQVAITTGGTIKLTLGAVDVVGATVTHANSDAVGTVKNASVSGGQIAMAAATAKVTKGQAIKVTPASFATAGAVNGWVRIVGGA